MKKQAGFTLIELAIVLVIIGLLLGGVLKGQELINSAKVKNMASDFKNTQVYIYGYQDKYRALPGDDKAASAHLGTGLPSDNGNGNGVIEGQWNSVLTTDESVLFWRHVRLAGLAAGPTNISDAAYFPTNADGGRLGVQSVSGFTTITGPTPMTGAYVICSDGILGKFAIQLDSTLDDGEASTGSVRVIKSGTTGAALTTAAINLLPSDTYTVCLAF